MYTSSISIDQVIDAVAEVISPFVGGAEIIRDQPNRAPMPLSGFVVLSDVSQEDLQLPRMDYVGNDSSEIYAPKKIGVQISFYGEAAGDWCNATKSALRTWYGCNLFPDGIKPLYVSNGMFVPMVDGEQQWLNRWVVTLTLQVNPTIEIPQQYSNELVVSEIINTDTLV